jgi:hypothetical protein
MSGGKHPKPFVMPKGSLTKHASIWGREAYLGVPSCSKNIGGGPNHNGFSWEKKREKMWVDPLTN